MDNDVDNPFVFRNFSWNATGLVDELTENTMQEILATKRQEGNCLLLSYCLNNSDWIPFPVQKKTIKHPTSDDDEIPAFKRYLFFTQSVNLPKHLRPLIKPQHVHSTYDKLPPDFVGFLTSLYEQVLIRGRKEYYSTRQKALTTAAEDGTFTHTEVQILYHLFNKKDEILAECNRDTQLHLYFASKLDVCDTCSLSMLQFMAAQLLGIRAEQVQISATTWFFYPGATYWGRKYNEREKLRKELDW